MKQGILVKKRKQPLAPPKRNGKSPNKPPNTNVRGRPRYSNKVKCFSLQPIQNTPEASRSRIMLGLKDSKDNTCCDYEQRSVVTKSKPSYKGKEQLSKPVFVKPKSKVPAVTVQEQGPVLKSEEGFGLGNTTATLTTTTTKTNNDIREGRDLHREKQDEERIDMENSVTFYTSPEQNEENSKAFIESLGSWINDLFHVPNKNSQMSTEIPKEDIQKESFSEEDAEYLKSISAIKEQFRKKLRSETSISVSVPERPFVFNFDRVLDSGKRNKKGTRSLPPPQNDNQIDWVEELNELEEQIAADTTEVPVRRYGPSLNATGLIIRTNALEESLQPAGKAKTAVKELNSSSILMKEKKKGKNKNRQEISDLEEYVFPTPSELSKRILLNVNENEKCGKIYKNSHHGVQETQPYCQRKGRSHQTNARCYTTTANPSENSKNSVLKRRGEYSSQYSTTSVMEAGTDEVFRRSTVDVRKNQLRKPSKKEISEITRDSMTFLKTKGKTGKNAQGGDAAKAEGKTSSDELVKYLMKKIKTTRPHNVKSRSSVSVPQLLSSPKNRFMQSATNTLVSVLAKNESSQLPAKSINRMLSEPRKELILKNDSNIRVDVSRAIAASKYSRLTYLLEDNNKVDDDYLLEKERFRSSKRSYDELLKNEGKKNSSKFNKRQEVKHMLSKIDSKFSPFPVTKRPKEPKKKQLDELINVAEIKEEQEGNPRFQKQHELFKTNLKMMQLNTNTEQEEQKDEVQAVSTSPSSLSTQLTVIDANLPLNNEQALEKTEAVEQTAAQLDPNTEIEELNCKVSELLDLEDKSNGQKAENKDKILKTKSLDFLKDTETKMMLSPLEKLYMSEQRETQKSYEPSHVSKPYESSHASKSFESSHGSTDLGQPKPPDTYLFNRRFSTNSLRDLAPKSRSGLWCGSPSKTPDAGKETNGDKKEAKEKKKGKTKTTGSKETSIESSCGFDASRKKPGPNCDKDE